MPPDPPRKISPSALKSRLPPTFPVGTSTSKLIDSTGNTSYTCVVALPSRVRLKSDVKRVKLLLDNKV